MSQLRAPRKGLFRAIRARYLLLASGLALLGQPGQAQTVVEQFSTTALRDAAATTARWTTDEQALVLAFREAQYGAFDPATVAGTNLSTDTNATFSIALGDVDGDGDLDVVVGNQSGPKRLYLNNGTSAPFAGVAGADIGTDADGTVSVALGDLDGDGDLDVVAGSNGVASRLYLNNGTSAPFAGVAGTDLSTDTNYTVSIALGDVDGDGDLDVVTGENSQANRLYLNNGTSAPFAGAVGSDISTDANATYAIALGDMDGDGDLDVVAGNISNQINRLYLNNGTGAPFAGVAGTNLSADANATYAIALGDVDADGDLDVVAGNYNQQNRLYLNNGTATPFNGVSGSDITADAQFTNAIALGDLDGDGDLDLVAGNLSQANRLYRNDGSADPFAGVTGSNVTADQFDSYAIALGDVDGDGDLDLVAGNISQVNRLYLNNGTATPFNGVSGSNITADSDATFAIALGDVDGDGDLDVVAGNYSQPNRLYLNNGTAAPFNGVTGSNITADAGNTYAIALGDLDGDGDLDVVAGNYIQQNRLYLNNGTAAPFTGVSGNDITTETGATAAIALGDLDGDGDLDVIAGNYAQPDRVYPNSGTGTFAFGSDLWPAGYNTRSLALGDIDGDGDLDAVAGHYDQVNRLYLNNGSASFQSTDLTTDDDATTAVALGDFDGDGDLDVVAINQVQRNRLYLNDGNANPFPSFTGTDLTADSDNSYSIALGDVDGDGQLDVVTGTLGTENRLYLNNGRATPFGAGVSGTDVTADSQATRAIALADVDGDGNLDVVAGNAGVANRLYLNNGTPTPFTGVTGSNISNDSQSTYAIALGDVNGDGYFDVVAGNTFQTNRLYLNNRTATPFDFVAGSNVTTDAHATYAVALGDVDGDGDLDLVAGNFSEPNRLYLNNGSFSTPFGGVTGSDITADSHDTLSLALGDVDGDGDLDFVVGNYNQPNRLYLNNGSGVFTGSNITADSNDTAAIALGDVDGDGDLDVVAGNGFETNRLYLNNGTAAPFNGVTGSDITADAQFTNAIVLGDVDGDGDLDVIDGTLNQPNRVYLNNGTAAPFNGVTGSDITTTGQSTYALALGDVDGDGHLDIAEGNVGQPNRLYLARLYDTGRGVATSLRMSSAPVGRATLTFAGALPRNTSVSWWLTGNGGARWFQVRPGVPFVFPAAARGNDLRWRAQLGSLSPASSPSIDSLTIFAESDTDGDGLLDSVDPDDDNDGVLDTADAFALDPAASIDTDGDGKPDDWNPGATPEQIAASLLIVDDDDDNDTVLDVTDNCPLNANPGQEDANNNGIGDVCEEEPLCFPVRAASGRIGMVCL